MEWRINDKISAHPGGDVFEDESELVSRDAALAVLLVVVHTVSTLCRCHNQYVESWSPGLVTSNCSKLFRGFMKNSQKLIQPLYKFRDFLKLVLISLALEP